MIELDERLLRLRAEARDWADELRPHALELDADPELVRRMLHLRAVRYVSRMMVPAEHQPDPLLIGPHAYYGTTALERAIVAEELACGDPGMFLASPGASLSGVLVGLLGDPEQQKWFFGRIVEEPTWTFFGLTEPGHGSDATALQTSLTAVPGGLRLDGEKRYAGNAARAGIGTVFARTGKGPLGVAAVLVDSSQEGFHAEPLPMIGLRGARISAIRLDGVEIAPERVLGRHLPVSARGMRGAMLTFHQFRPGVAALALGIARAAQEYGTAHRESLDAAGRAELERIGREVDATRQLVWAAALSVDRDPHRGVYASAAKARAAQLAEQATLRVTELLGPGALFDHPLLDKLVRDARGVEFMEGTSNIQRLNLGQAVAGGRLEG
ncbi:acyl-CoA dehydrogenase family protein [Actinacidiphila yeochonensis]|uniref:acyl-CoA dehydrogenase family protein n=1 Tax=Actinacidiphila yeochonensis TaxID=89050 RepID=UPI00068D1039|nr:acyl-CoA dehydrogenase family protein [Actinacidiphila yeochonensis]